MSMVRIYECLCDETRLRIVHLLTRGPLCVCHLQSVLAVPQARVSQHLAYLKQRGMVENLRRANWMVYSLPKNPTPELHRHLACLQDCASENAKFRADLRKLAKISSDCKPAKKLDALRLEAATKEIGLKETTL